MTGYCANCKKNVEMKDPRPARIPNGKRITKGKCPGCGTEIWKGDN